MSPKAKRIHLPNGKTIPEYSIRGKIDSSGTCVRVFVTLFKSSGKTKTQNENIENIAFHVIRSVIVLNTNE